MLNFLDKMPELEQKSFQKRQVAHKVRVSDIINSIFVRDDISAGYIKFNNYNVSRVNIIGTIVYKSDSANYFSVIIDDGTGKISFRTFDNGNIFSKIEVGDIVLCIGKLREFNNEKYVMPEILRKVNDTGWVGLRQLELSNAKIARSGVAIENNDILDKTTAHEQIFSIIRLLDQGEGASFEDVIKNSKILESEKIINKLLENGDIFEVKPGRLKVLE